MAELGTIHGAEMPYIFGGPVEDAYFLAEEDRGFASIVADYWVEFARTGNPNGDSRQAWPAFSTDAQSYLELSDTFESRSDLRQKYCAFWDSTPSTDM